MLQRGFDYATVYAFITQCECGVVELPRPTGPVIPVNE